MLYVRLITPEQIDVNGCRVSVVHSIQYFIMTFLYFHELKWLHAVAKRVHVKYTQPVLNERNVIHYLGRTVLQCGKHYFVKRSTLTLIEFFFF